MSHSAGKKPPTPKRTVNILSDQLRDTLSIDDEDKKKPDFRELERDLNAVKSGKSSEGSPISPLHRQQSTTTTSTSTSTTTTSSGGSNVKTPSQNVRKSKTHSGEISGSSSESSPRTQTTRRFDAVTSPVVNVLPVGNICPSGKVVTTGMATRSPRSDVLGSGTGNYGHGNIMRGGGSVGTGLKSGIRKSDAEELKRAGNEYYSSGNYAEALSLYDRAILVDKENVAHRSNKAAALTALGRLGEAVREYEEALRLDPKYWRVSHRLGSLLLRLGQTECARKHICHPDHAEMLKLQSIEKHLCKCEDARRVGDWKSAVKECDATIAAGADCCPQLFMFRIEALLKLHQLEDAECNLSMVPRLEPYPKSCSLTKFFGMLSEAYLYFVQAQIEIALGRFDDAVTAAEKAAQIDSRNVDIAVLSKNVKLVTRARARGNNLFKSERFTEACAAYDEGLRLDPFNSVLYCNRAACYFKLGRWEQSINDSSQALRIRPSYMKALCRRAACYNKLKRWEDAVRDYEILRRECAGDNEIAEALFHAQVALKKSRGEEVSNMKFGGDVEEISGLDQFKAAISQGISVVYFKVASDLRCKQMHSFVDTLCGRYPLVNFLQVDIEESPIVADNENVRIIPTFKIYKNGSRVKEIVCPTREMLESSVKHYSL